MEKSLKPDYFSAACQQCSVIFAAVLHDTTKSGQFHVSGPLSLARTRPVSQETKGPTRLFVKQTRTNFYIWEAAS